MKQVGKKKSRNMFGQNHHKGFRIAFIFFIKLGIVNTYAFFRKSLQKSIFPLQLASMESSPVTGRREQSKLHGMHT